MVILHGDSAWAWYRTPPAVREIEIDDDAARQLSIIEPEIKSSLAAARHTFGEALETVQHRVLFDLKGVPLPVHILISDEQACRHRSKLVQAHLQIWKIPPLLRPEELVALENIAFGIRGRSAACRAAQFVSGGSASPLETAAYLILTLPPRLGGEGWPAPDLNRRIILSPQARQITGTGSVVADMLWPQLRALLEINGAAFHTGREAFTRAANRRAALEAMDYTYLELTYEQMSNFTNLEAILAGFAKRLGFPLRKRDEKFLSRRRRLLDELFR